MAKAEPGHLLVSQAKQRIVVAFGNLNGGRQLALNNRAVRVVVEFRGIVISVGVIIDSLFGNAGERHPGVIFYGLPGF